MKPRGIALFAGLAALTASAGSALAHGDRASEVLQTHPVFFPLSGGAVAPGSSTGLERAVQQANQAGYPIRVAVIATPYDLAARSAFWKTPQAYARFLGDELLQAFPDGRILVAMPSGFGLLRGTAREERTLRRITTGRSADDLVRATTVAVARLADLPGFEIALPRGQKDDSSWGGTRLAIALGGVATLALLGTLAYVYFPGRRP